MIVLLKNKMSFLQIKQYLSQLWISPNLFNSMFLASYLKMNLLEILQKVHQWLHTFFLYCQSFVVIWTKFSKLEYNMACRFLFTHFALFNSYRNSSTLFLSKNLHVFTNQLILQLYYTYYSNILYLD